jgi:hypothetical protein
MKQPRKKNGSTAVSVRMKTASVVHISEADQRQIDIAARLDAKDGIRQGLEDAKNGRVRTAKEFFDEFEARNGIPR